MLCAHILTFFVRSQIIGLAWKILWCTIILVLSLLSSDNFFYVHTTFLNSSGFFGLFGVIMQKAGLFFCDWVSVCIILFLVILRGLLFLSVLAHWHVHTTGLTFLDGWRFSKTWKKNPTFFSSTKSGMNDVF